MITNCPNCGAPIDISRNSCEYCGTPYEKSKPDPSIEDFAEVLSRISRCSGFNLMDTTEAATLYADNQPVQIYSQVRASIQTTQQELLSGIASAGIEYCDTQLNAWQPTPEEERKMIEDMRNVTPMIFPEVEPTVEYIKYNTKLERLMDTVWFWFVVLIITIGCSFLPFIIF